MTEHAGELGFSDLLRWRARSDKGEAAPVITKLAELAAREPMRFKHEVLSAPRLDFEQAEWHLLAELLRGKVDDELYQSVVVRGASSAAEASKAESAAPPRGPEADFLLDAGSLLDEPGGGGGSEGGGLSFFDGLDDGEGDFGFGLGSQAEGGASEELKEPPPEGEDWSPSITRFSASLRDAVLDKVKKTPRGDERAVLLSWLEQQGVAKKALIALATDALLEHEISASMLSWLSKQLANRTAWDRDGVVVLAAMIERRAFPEMSDLFTFSWNEASTSEDKDVPRAFFPSVQAAFAFALLQVARKAVEEGRSDRAMAALSGLACLDPPSRVSRTLHDLAKLPGLDEEVLHLIQVNERLIKHSDARDATLEGIIAAVHALADAFT